MIRIILVTNPIDPGRGKIVREEQYKYPGLRILLISEVWDCSEDFEVWAKSHTVSVNGHVWAQSLWAEVAIKDGDCIVIAPIVKGGSLMKTLASVALMAGTIALTATGAGAVAGAWLGSLVFTGDIAIGATSAAIFAGAVSILGNLLIGAFLGPSQPTNKGSSASYDPDGPKSLAQSGSVIPKGYGTFMWGGNCIASFTDIAGSDQYINNLYCYGFGPARSITGIQIAGKDISEYQNTQYYTRLGTNDQTEIANFNQIVNGYPQETQCLAGIPVVVPGTGDLTQALQVDVAFPGGLFVNTNDGNIIPAVITYQVQYRVAANGLDAPGPWISPQYPQTTTPVVNFNPDGSAFLPFSWGVIATDLPGTAYVVYNMDNGPHTPGDVWTGPVQIETFEANGNHTTVNKNCTGEWQLLDITMNYVLVETWTNGYVDFVASQITACYNRTLILGLAPNKYDVQINKYGSARLHDDVPFGDNWSPNVGQDMWVHSINEVSYLDLCYPNMILIAIRILATTQLSGANLTCTAVIEHGCRSVDEGLMPAGLLNFEENNPACVAADMMVDDLYGGGSTGGCTAFNIEQFIDEWIQWADLNDTLAPDGNGNSIRLHAFNGVFDNEGDLWTQLNVVTAMSRACIVPLGLNYGVAVDDVVDAPVQMFTVGNIIQDSFTETFLNIDDRSSQVEIQFADSTRFYREDNPLVYMDPDQQNDGTLVKPTRIRAKGVTIPAQAWHMARYKQRSTEYLLRSGSFKTDTAGIACRPFNVIALQHDVPQWGFGGRTLPGSTANVLLLDRSDVTFVAGTSYSVMVLHPDLLRFTGTVGAIATTTNPPGFSLSVAGWTNTVRITRAIVDDVDCEVLNSSPGSVIVSPPPGFTPATGQPVELWDTDVMETVPVTGLDPFNKSLQLGTALSRVPQEYSSYIFGAAGSVKLVRVTLIRKSNEERSTIEWIDYDPDIYTLATPVIGETSAQTTSSPGVKSLTGKEIVQMVSGSYVSYASLAWQNGPDTVGVGIYITYPGSPAQAQLVARVGHATSYQVQQSPEVTAVYTVVGYDANDTYAGFTSAPSVTIETFGVATNLLLGSSFASGFTYWSISPRAGDTFVPSFADDGQAVYTIAGSALTDARQICLQQIPATKWSVGAYLMLSGYIEDSCESSSAPNVGQVSLAIVFQDATGAVLGMASVPAPLNGTTPTLNRFNTAVAQIPAGTAAVTVAVSLAGTGLNLPVGSTVTMSHFLLEVGSATQTEPSAWADIDVNGNVLDMFTTGSSTGLRVQGSVLPSFIGSFAYTTTGTTLTITWTGLIILWPDGATTYITDGDIQIAGLTASTDYFAFLYFNIVYAGIAAAVPGTPLGTPAILSAAYDPNADAACRQDGRVALTTGGFKMTTAATGGTGGGIGGNPIQCTVRGTVLQTPEGNLSNEVIKARFDAGEDVYLIGREGPELIAHTFWAPVQHTYLIEIEGFLSFGCSESTTLKPKGEDHRWCSHIPDGTLVDTVAGYRALSKVRVDEPNEVLFIELAGPSHEYLVVDGVWTHNKVRPPVLQDQPPS